ncbi:MAG: glycoside hydrolase family 88 protein [Gammaproteobacteria bacterium]|nr:glycoside hydrolase family 88 protein [Gammaproteobacteria bacterium]
MSAEPMAVATRLAGVYGHAIEQPLMYPTGVAIAGRLRLAAHRQQDLANSIAGLVDAMAADPQAVPDAAPSLAIACFADELFAETNDPRHRDFLLALAQRFHADPDIRVEDFFFAGTLLGRAYALTGETSYRDRLVDFLRRIDTRQANGLYWHCHASPYFWGRGNAFAALGFAEALSYLDWRNDAADIAATHREHLAALASFQHPSGLWHQLIDDPATYLEHSATTMIGYAIARGLRAGWLAPDPWRACAERAWAGAAARIGADGELDQVCVGTGPLDSRQAYVERPFSTGVDSRGGAMALWFAVEMTRLVIPHPRQGANP